MQLISKINGKNYQVAFDRAESIAIVLDFKGPQPSHFGVAPATAKPYQAGSFVGDTRQGGSCNCDEIVLVPHCVGTHTESIGHVTNDHKSLSDCNANTLTPATLITVKPFSIDEDEYNNSYQPALENSDIFISLEMLQQQLGNLEDNINNEFLTTLIVRTLPNPVDKQFNQYGKHCQPPFFSNQAMDFISCLPVKNIIVDFPSIDRMIDEGTLSNHRLFWEIRPGGKEIESASDSQRTVTEMAFIKDAISDGHYLINIQFPSWKTDAIPSKPCLYPLKKL